MPTGVVQALMVMPVLSNVTWLLRFPIIGASIAITIIHYTLLMAMMNDRT
ncbi:MAG: hypothetical protein MJE68_23455 [Proteobacteria bacterium]|nr:hypothetical protein [Pseudomonadota bacterium]